MVSFSAMHSKAKISQQMKFPRIKRRNPTDQPTRVHLSSDSYLKAGSSLPRVTVRITPTIQTSTVLLTSIMARARELRVLAMVTPVPLQRQEEARLMTKPVISMFLLKTSSKKTPALQTTATPSELKTQALSLKGHGMTPRMGMTTPENPVLQTPSRPNIQRGLRLYFLRIFSQQINRNPAPIIPISMRKYPKAAMELLSPWSPMMKLTAPTVVSPKRTMMQPTILCFLGLTLRITIVKRYVVRTVPPRSIWQTDPAMKLRAVQKQQEAKKSSRVGISMIAGLRNRAPGSWQGIFLTIIAIKHSELETALMATYMDMVLLVYMDEKSSCWGAPFRLSSDCS